MAASTAKEVGLFGWGYNRAAFQFDAKQRWARFTSGRKFAVSQVDMFRQDVSDFAAVATVKLKTYAPVMTMACGYCLTIFVEARSGLKFPAPPTFISGLYLQCLGIAFAFLTLGTWLVFHAALRAQAMAVQLRTRRIRVPVPTQRQLDSARQLLSNFEEQNPYDIFRMPFVMPQIGNTPEGYAEVEGSEPAATKTAGGSGKSKKASKAGGKKGAQSSEANAQDWSLRAPRFAGGNPSWIGKEVEMRDEFPTESPSGYGIEGPTEPFEHFELVRSVQQEYWGAEAYCRVCFLYGMMHLIQSFCYWLVIHCIAELAMVWCANVLAASLSAAVLLMFRLDVSPDKGGCFPVEAFGPFVAAIAMSLFYAHSYNQTTIDIGRAVAVGVLLMQILWTFRLYAVAKPSNNAPGKARENAGGRLFSASGNCDAPSWLPSAFQHVTYLIAPPKQKGAPAEPQSGEDPMEKVDMTPWYYTRALLITVIVGWFILLAGRVVEIAMGERMLMSTPGHPPWTRTGQWDGWEHGPISSKHYAHVTPQKGHFAWQPGWGPNGQQELWASDMFGFAPEADMWWTEDGVSGAPYHGENTWYQKKLNYGRYAVIVSTAHDAHGPGDHGDSHGDSHSGDSHSSSLGSHGDNHHRRLQQPSFATRSLVPAAVQWPSFLEPELLACGPASANGAVAAFTSNGLGAVLTAEVAAGRAAGAGMPFNIQGLLELGRLLSASWAEEGLVLVASHGQLASCAAPAEDGNLNCSPMPIPALPLAFAGQPAAATRVGSTIRAAIASPEIGLVTLWELAARGNNGFAWHQTAQVELPADLISVAFAAESLVVTGRDGATHWLFLRDGVPVSDVVSEAPVPGFQRTWHASCMMPSRKVVRLASSWKRTAGGVEMLHPELLV